MRIAIEMDDSDIKKYGSIHKEGCRDLRDPERLGEASSATEAHELAEGLTGWGYDEGEYHISPCVKF